MSENTAGDNAIKDVLPIDDGKLIVNVKRGLPRLSVFTPTHRPDHLEETWQSLQAQTYANFEWVLVPNGGARIPNSILQDARVIVRGAPDGCRGVGALKHFACKQCSGDYLVELDHDDLLHETALQRIAEVAAEKQPGFIYSDNVNFYPNWSCQRFSEQFLWSWYETTWRGKKLTAVRAFPPSPASLRTIHYAPNHVRVWSRAVYEQIGGHDTTLHVMDDLDLMCRTYLSGTEFVHIPECLYFYRLQHGTNQTNTYLEMNEDVQKLNIEVGNRFFYPLMEEWARRMGLMRLDMGGGINGKKDYTIVDVKDADILCEVGAEPIPIMDNSVGIIRCHDFLEHIPPCSRKCIRDGVHGDCVVGVMNEFYRILAPGGWLCISVPSTDGRGAWQDPSHVSGWNTNSFWYYTDRDQGRFVRGLECRYQSVNPRNVFPTEWHRQHKIVYAQVEMQALKGQHTPGLEKI